MPLSLCDDCLDKEADRAGAIGTNVDLVRDGSPAGGTIAAFDFTERRQVPNGSLRLGYNADSVRGRGPYDRSWHIASSRCYGATRRLSGKTDSGAASARLIYDGVDAPPTASMCQSGGVEHHLREASVSKVIIIGLDIAKHVFHAHGADERGRAVFSKKIGRGKLLDFFAAQPSCTVALEACGGAHHWARQLTQLGHEVRLIPPAYVKPFVKRQKNDAIDAEAICEAAQRPSMRFVAVKSEQQQAAGLVFRTRDLLVRQRTQLINAIRGHLTEYGWIAPKGPSHVAMLADLLEEKMARSLPEAARAMFLLMLDLLAGLEGKIADLDKEIARRAREDEVSRRLMTVPGVGPISATAIAALAPPAETFVKGRDFAAWLGLTPLQRSTGGKQKLGVTSKMGERTLRRLLIIGSSAVVQQASKRGAPKGSWLEQMLARKPRMLVIVALANKMARIIWALLVKQENYRAPVAAKA
jgi:transposase